MEEANSPALVKKEELDSSRPVSLVVALVGFVCGIAGFFLSWGTYVDSQQIAGTSQIVTITQHHTGATAGWYGYATLALAVVGTGLAMWRLLKGRFAVGKFKLATTAWVGALLLTVVVRNDPNVKVFGTVGYALRTGDYTLGYTLGPGLALAGFAAAAIAAMFLPRTSGGDETT